MTVYRTGSPFWLRVNGKWLHLEGVTPGVDVARDRSVSDFTSIGGVRHVSSALRAARSWTLDFRHAAPEAVRALLLAANSQAGDVMLLDASASRANMLDPLDCVGSVGAPLIDVAGMPLPALNAAPSSVVSETALSANLALFGYDVAIASIIMVSGQWESLVKVSVPSLPSAAESAGLVFSAVPGNGMGDISAYACSNAWSESSSAADVWDGIPAGALVGSAVLVGSEWHIPIPDIEAFYGTSMSLRLKTSTVSSPADRFYAVPSMRPKLRITYTDDTPTTPLPVFHPVRAHVPHHLMCWTTADQGDPVFRHRINGGPWTTTLAPSGSLSRPCSAVFTPDVDGEVEIQVSAGDHLTTGLRLVDTVVDVNRWLPGQKTPCRVHVQDPSQTLNLLADGKHGRSDYSVTLLEVG